MPISDSDYLKHIRDEARYIVRKSSQLEFDFFIGDETLLRAFVRSLEVVGEAPGKSQSTHNSSNPGWARCLSY